MSTIIADLQSEFNTLFPDNTKKQIEPSDLRQAFMDFLAAFNQDLNFDVPASGDTVTVTPSYLNTTVRFKGVIADDFTLNIIGNVADLIPGQSTLMLIMGGDGTTNGKVVTFSGDIQFTQCGTVQADWTTVDRTQVFPLVWDGTKFTGIDNC